MSTITKERLEQLANFRGAPVTRQEEQELARIVLASLEEEPAGWQVKKHGGDWVSIKKEDVDHYRFNEDLPVREVYTATPSTVYVPAAMEMDYDFDSAFEHGKAVGWNACRAAMLQGAEPVTTANKLPEETGSSLQLRNLIRQRHAEWSRATFGDVGPVGPLKHLSKEALEAAEEPEDLSEWADMQFLLWDAQRRAGISDGEITAAMEEKLKVNMARQWPEPKDGEPRLHIKDDGNSPVIPDGLRLALSNAGIAAPESDEMLAATCEKHIQALVTWVKERQPFKSAVIPDGYCIMPLKLTADNGAKGALCGEFHVQYRIVCQSCVGEGCEDCNHTGGWNAEIPVSWDTIKRIHESAVEACALPAAPQQEVTQALAKGMERYGDAMQELAQREMK